MIFWATEMDSKDQDKCTLVCGVTSAEENGLYETLELLQT